MDSIQPPEPHTLVAVKRKTRRDTNLWRGQARYCYLPGFPGLRPAIKWVAFLESVSSIGTPC